MGNTISLQVREKACEGGGGKGAGGKGGREEEGRVVGGLMRKK